MAGAGRVVMPARRAGERWAASAPAESHRSEQLRLHTPRVLVSRALAKRGMDEAQVRSRVQARTFSEEDSAETLYFFSAFVIRYYYAYPRRGSFDKTVGRSTWSPNVTRCTPQYRTPQYTPVPILAVHLFSLTSQDVHGST